MNRSSKPLLGITNLVSTVSLLKLCKYTGCRPIDIKRAREAESLAVLPDEVIDKILYIYGMDSEEDLKRFIDDFDSLLDSEKKEYRMECYLRLENNASMSKFRDLM